MQFVSAQMNMERFSLMEEIQIDGEEQIGNEAGNGFHRMLRSDRDFRLFLLAGLFAGVGTGINISIFNNYLSDVYKLTEDLRGFLEVPREAPGFFIIVVLAVLSFIGDVRIAMIGMAAAGAGMLGLGLLSPTFAVMIIWMMMYSLGTHMIMTVTPSIGMTLSEEKSFGARLGTVSAFSLSGSIIAYIYIFLGFHFLQMTYQTAFITGTVFYVSAAFALGLMKKSRPKVRKVRFVFRRRYSLYYVLAVISGARAQIFLTFAPWVLIKVFGVEPQMFAILGMIVALVSIGTRKVIGMLIDSRGERFVLTMEAMLLFVICLGYAFSANIFPAGVAAVIIAGCYVIDNSMSAVEMARSTYVRKITVDLADVTPTLSTGISLQHIASMIIPVFGGLLWSRYGYQAVFIGAAVVAFLNFVLSRRIKIELDPPVRAE
jgi:MFS family permease